MFFIILYVLLKDSDHTMEHFSKSHYDLDELKALIEKPETRVITKKARVNAATLGFATKEDIVEQVLKIKRTDIYKTMTVDDDYTLWQDVYRPTINNVVCYIKLQKSHSGNGVVIQFKLKDE
ncbi:MAG: type II toxin-antitoxin system MqsR family toxin [Spirochaetes bacterium]|nr:type II toxin-antitoxin system MqsR family toxin [Spirochaetota bacterium]